MEYFIMSPAALDKWRERKEVDGTLGNNWNEKCHLEFSVIELLLSLDWKADRGSKIAFTKKHWSSAQTNSSFINIWYFFHSCVDCCDMAVTQLSPLLLSQAISSWNCFPERAERQSHLATMHTCQQHLVVSWSIMNLLQWTVSNI